MRCQMSDWIKYVSPEADKRLFEIERRVRGRDDDADDETKWLLGYIALLKGNLRANQDGSD